MIVHSGKNEERHAQQSRYTWGENQHDYKYEELLQRIFGFLHENNPELVGRDKRRRALRPPQILVEGSAKTVFVNLMDLSETMHRQPVHVMTFFLTELGTSGSLDGENRLVVQGKFPSNSFEDLLRKYINEYVLCRCKSPDTCLSKEKRVLLLQCEMCGSARSVAPVEAGYAARVEGRKTGA